MTTDDPNDAGGDEAPVSDELIEADMPCLRCGYNLRGLKPVGQCPECGARIEKTVEYVMARILCPVCMGPNHPTAAICIHCKSPVSGAAATASYWKTAAISDRRGREPYADDEPEAPSAAWAFMCGTLGAIVIVWIVSNWVINLTRPPQDAETHVPVLVVLMLASLLLIFLAWKLIKLPLNQYLRLRREFHIKHTAWLARDRSKDDDSPGDDESEEAEEGDDEEHPERA